jgi:ATP-dependent Clp protease ATP-binding subunit ClpC
VLLGLLRTEDSVAARALRLLGVTHRKARRRIVRLVDVGSEDGEARLAFTPCVREILEDAFSGAIWLPRVAGTSLAPRQRRAPQPRAPRLRAPEDDRVRSEHLLFALLAHGEGVAAHVLTDLGVDLARLAVAIQHVRFPDPTRRPFAEQPRWPPAPPERN